MEALLEAIYDINILILYLLAAQFGANRVMRYFNTNQAKGSDVTGVATSDVT